METVRYQLRVTGLQVPEGTISARNLLDLLGGLLDCAEKRLRLAVEGVSTQSGRPPGWLSRAVDVRITGIRKGSTVFDLDAPTLGSVLGDQLRQQDFWIAPPDAQDTAFTLLASAIHDTTDENRESESFDAGVLGSLLGLKPFLKAEAKTIELRSSARPRDAVCLTLVEMEKAERLSISTPEPRAMVVSGHLDSIQHSKRRFRLALPGGVALVGRIDEEHLGAESLREFWGREVTVRGTVHFKPSGRPHMMVANVIRMKRAGEEVFEYTPMIQTEAGFVAESRRDAERDWLADVWGRWPGEETTEEILQGLKD